jgi:acetylornithine deacetylase/succinyl-diaminopimelate desuccinylase-like protein
MDIRTDFIRFLDDHFPQMLDDLMELAAIPAPSHHEEKRAAWVKAYLERYGAQDVTIDRALNVILNLNPGADDYAVYMAHTDVVFPDTTPLPVVREDHIIRAPGIGDDTANLIVLLLVARYILENRLKPKRGVLIVANSCEEGLGNLKGVRQICGDYPVRELVTFDGSLGRIVNTAVGSQRYRVSVRTEGGHSFGSFGNRSAIAYLARMIATLYEIKAPVYGKTTYNVGTIEGGTSVNTIAQEAQMLYEFRSDDRRGLSEMQTFFESVLNTYRAMGITVECELLGVRPCNGDIDAARQKALEERVAAHSLSVTGTPVSFGSGSTDANIPLSMGIPALCTGVVTGGGGTHTREEWIDITDLKKGAVFCANVVLDEFV